MALKERRISALCWFGGDSVVQEMAVSEVRVITGSARLLSWLNEGEKTDVVYIALDRLNKPVYVGKTNDIIARLAQHLRDGKSFSYLRKISGSENLTPHQARAIEQIIIENNPNYQNVYNSISNRRDIYEGAIEWAINFMKTNNISTKY